ncbi:MAG TPA: hypothetical protein PK177_02900 [Burkholderiaceae bacterium]|nr:hypothetical protein [Burkholderiaceae bacterium]
MKPGAPRAGAPKLAAGAFLSGAKGRLLPASLPFRFFGAAIAFHLLAWVALFFGADAFPRFQGGLGWTLAALHLITLGTLAMTAIGASLQLLPVATRQPVGSPRSIALLWWAYTPGVAVLVLGMGFAQTRLLAAGALLVVAALLGYALLLARNLVGARGMHGVVAHGWGALASLLVALASALALAGAYVGWPLLGRGSALSLHVVFAAYGFMGLLALGLAYILVPMFALSPAPPETRVRSSAALAIAALALAGLASFDVAPLALRIAALAAAAAAIALHLRSMTVALATGLRRALGRSFTLVRIAWALLVASLLLALGLVIELSLPGLPALFGLLLIAGWLLGLLLGFLQRILPFLASMHAGAGRRLPPTPSSLTADRPLSIHFGCHFAALALLTLGILVDSPLLARLGAVAGFVGASAYAWFFALLLHRTWGAGSAAPRAAPNAPSADAPSPNPPP